MAEVLIGFLLSVLIVGSSGLDIKDSGSCYSNYLSLFRVVTDERTQRLLNEADVKKEFKKVEKQNKMLGDKLNNLSRNQHSVDNKQVAFSGTLTHKIPKSEFGQVVKFNKVTTNIGNAYDTSTGIFRSPVSGLYLVSSSVLGDRVGAILLATHHNGKIIARSHSGAGGHDHNSGTDTSVIHAWKGDEISSKVISANAAYLDHFSRFTVALLKAD